MWIYYLKKISRNWRISFLKQNLSPGICIQANVQWVLFSQPTSRCISSDMHISNTGNAAVYCCVVTAEPHQLQFSARWNYFCTVTSLFWPRLIDTHARMHASTRVHILKSTWAHMDRVRHQTKNGNRNRHVIQLRRGCSLLIDFSGPREYAFHINTDPIMWGMYSSIFRMLYTAVGQYRKIQQTFHSTSY
jgi:hypothetical protein